MLDHAVHAALTGPQADLAVPFGPALCFPADVARFMALAPDASDADWRAAAAAADPGAVLAAVRDTDAPPPGWDVTRSFGLVQMTAERALGRPEPEAIVLGADDVPDMLALVEQTQPGPFLERTIAMGRYIGVRSPDGELIAMAGERLHPPGWTEISAVCTAPSARGQGLATRLIGDVAAGIEARGERVFLHTAETNATAIALYEHLGFVVRARFTITVMSPSPV